MKSMQRLGLTALVLAVATLFTASPVMAGKVAGTGKVSLSIAFTLPADAPEPAAVGKGNMDWDMYAGFTQPINVTLSCRGLIPGTQYSVVIHRSWVGGTWGFPQRYDDYEEHLFTADAKGRLNGQFTPRFSADQLDEIEDLWIENDAGQVVLEGQWQWPPIPTKGH